MRVRALVDTGANVTCIPSKLAEELKLTYVDSSTASTASGKEEKSRLWIADIHVILKPSGLKEFPNLQVSETRAENMLLGMDIIEQGKLCIENKRLTLSFSAT